MALFVVSYDLHRARDYSRIINGIEGDGGVRLLESVWLLEVVNNAVGLRDALMNYVDADDSIAVIELKPGSGWGTMLARKAGTDWLSAHVTPAG